MMKGKKIIKLVPILLYDNKTMSGKSSYNQTLTTQPSIDGKLVHRDKRIPCEMGSKFKHQEASFR